MNTESQEAAKDANVAHTEATHSLSTILQTTSGSVERAQRFIALIVEEIPPLLSDLDLEKAGADLKTITRAAHTLKTHASYVGAQAFRQQAERTELLSRSENTEDLRNQTQQLATLGYATLNALKSIDWEALSQNAPSHNG